ncbi:hypothetical protein BCV72DRAFT_101022 [Rhizopus microsporus var. microsporus]|uniref:Uncharacterized protein n=1 Tax=Rhizopus microsporus var. microsporus TaxID=86635 RepID=A0A1X0R781_RHIZD|nr:hypothetical protein BCV72DRAFT_101022 [Rhizopus microsporus var. microsporus]
MRKKGRKNTKFINKQHLKVIIFVSFFVYIHLIYKGRQFRSVCDPGQATDQTSLERKGHPVSLSLTPKQPPRDSRFSTH